MHAWHSITTHFLNYTPVLLAPSRKYPGDSRPRLTRVPSPVNLQLTHQAWSRSTPVSGLLPHTCGMYGGQWKPGWGDGTRLQRWNTAAVHMWGDGTWLQYICMGQAARSVASRLENLGGGAAACMAVGCMNDGHDAMSQAPCMVIDGEGIAADHTHT